METKAKDSVRSEVSAALASVRRWWVQSVPEEPPVSEQRMRKVTRNGYLLILGAYLPLWGLLTLWPTAPSNWIYAIVSVIAAGAACTLTYKRMHVVSTPLTLFALVWLVMVPATSFAAPIMQPMSTREILICIVGGAAYSAGGVLLSLHGPKSPLPPHHPGRAAPNPVSDTMLMLAELLIVISISAIILNTALEGSFALTRAGSESRKALGAFPGYAFFAAAGTVSMVIYANAARVKWRHIAESALYLGLQILTGQRFVAIAGLLLVIVAMSSLRPVSRKVLTWVGTATVALAGVFGVVSLFRGGESDMYRYFIESGRYSGDVRALTATEILRYVGMSQRNMSTVFDTAFNPEHLLRFTASPIVALFGDVQQGLGTTINGYTANNAISYMYSDVGTLWPLLAFAWGLVVNFTYWRAVRSPSSLTLRFIWQVAAMGLTLSFFAYVNAYVYWVLLFPLGVYVADRTTQSPRFNAIRERWLSRLSKRRGGGRGRR